MIVQRLENRALKLDQADKVGAEIGKLIGAFHLGLGIECTKCGRVYCHICASRIFDCKCGSLNFVHIRYEAT